MSRVLAIVLGLALAGCLAPGDSELTRTWSLPVPAGTGPKVQVFLPAELRTPRLVAGDAEGRPVPRDLDRWEKPLSQAMARTISAGLLDAGLSRVIVELEELKVDAAGRFRAVYRATLTLSGPPGVPDLEWKVGGGSAGITSEGEEGVDRAVRAYAAAAQTLAADILVALRVAKGEIANPDAAVTVPGQ